MRKISKQRIRQPRKHYALSYELRTATMEERYAIFEEIIRSIPRGKVATYGQVAQAAGYPRGHRLVASFLREMSYHDLPWQRVLGAGGEIKTTGKSAAKQRSLLKSEDVPCVGSRVAMDRYGHIFD